MAISCSDVTGHGSPTVTTNNTTRNITAPLNTTNSAKACTITNYKRAQITLNKSIVGGRINSADQFTVSATRSGGSALTGTTSATTTGTNTSATTGPFYASGNSALYSNPSITLTDVMAPGSVSAITQYASSLTCTNATAGSPTALPSGIITTSYTIYPNPNDNITCTFTNTNSPANLTLRKTWVNAIVNDAVNVTATGLVTLASVANTANETDTGITQGVLRGTAYTIGETFTVGSALNYFKTLACTGTSGLSGNILTVGSGDTSIVCTYTNTFNAQPNLFILKSASRSNANSGQTMLYTVQVYNNGPGIGTNVVLQDALSHYSAFSLNYNGGTRFLLTEGAPPSTLTLGTPQYSSDNGTSWSYTPVSGGGGAPADYDGNVTNWMIPMTGTIPVNGRFTLNYEVIVK